MLEVKKNQNENTASLLRRFKNKIKQANLIMEAKSRKFKQRDISKTKKKKGTLKRIERQKQNEYLRRWGKK